MKKLFTILKTTLVARYLIAAGLCLIIAVVMVVSISEQPAKVEAISSDESSVSYLTGTVAIEDIDDEVNYVKVEVPQNLNLEAIAYEDDDIDPLSYYSENFDYSTTIIEDEDKFAYIKLSDESRQICLDFALSKEEYLTLVKLLHYEYGYGSVEGQAAVCSVVLNRMDSDLFPNTIKEIITQPGQFNPRYAYDFVEPTESNNEAIRLAYSGVDYSNGGIFYCNPENVYGDTKSWFLSLKQTAAIDGGLHCFYTVWE